VNDLIELIEYGEVRIWRNNTHYCGELIFEIPAGEIRMILARESTLEELFYSLRLEVEQLAGR
jgi:hypothetical protein